MVIISGCSRTDTTISVSTNVSDVVLTNGKIYTVDSKQPWAEAIAVKGNKIVFVGASKDAEKFTRKNTKGKEGKRGRVLNYHRFKKKGKGKGVGY